MTPIASDLDQFQTAFLYQLRSYVRTWRFIGLLVFVAIIAAVILAVQLHRGITTVMATNPTSSDYLSGYLAFIQDAVIITAAFLGGDALAVDLGGGPGYLMLTQPVRRGTLLAGRYAAAAVTGAAIGLVYYAFAAVAVQYFYGNIPIGILWSIGAAFLFLLAVLAVAFFFSSFFRNPTVSIVASLLILIIGFPIITDVGTLTGVEPWFSLDYGSQIITTVLATHFSHETISHIGTGRRGFSVSIFAFSPYPWEGAAIMAVYLAVFLILCYIVYHFKEVRG